MMDLDLPVYERSTVKRTFYYFLAFNVLVCAASIFLVALTPVPIPGRAVITDNTWLIMGALLLSSFAFSAKSKKELKAVQETADFKDLIPKYESYYRRKLVWNGFSLVISALFFVMTEKNLFFYILMLQLVLSGAFFPSKKLIARELNNNGIIFT